MHEHLDARVREKKGTADGVEYKEPVAVEILRTHGRGQRTSERGRKRWRERAGVHGLDRRTSGQQGRERGKIERSRDVAEKTGKAEGLTGTGLKGWDRVLATTLSEPGRWKMSLVNSEM